MAAHFENSAPFGERNPAQENKALSRLYQDILISKNVSRYDQKGLSVAEVPSFSSKVSLAVEDEVAALDEKMPGFGKGGIETSTYTGGSSSSSAATSTSKTTSVRATNRASRGGAAGTMNSYPDEQVGHDEKSMQWHHATSGKGTAQQNSSPEVQLQSSVRTHHQEADIMPSSSRLPSSTQSASARGRESCMTATRRNDLNSKGNQHEYLDEDPVLVPEAWHSTSSSAGSSCTVNKNIIRRASTWRNSKSNVATNHLNNNKGGTLTFGTAAQSTSAQEDELHHHAGTAAQSTSAQEDELHHYQAKLVPPPPPPPPGLHLLNRRSTRPSAGMSSAPTTLCSTAAGRVEYHQRLSKSPGGSWSRGRGPRHTQSSSASSQHQSCDNNVNVARPSFINKGSGGSGYLQRPREQENSRPCTVGREETTSSASSQAAIAPSPPPAPVRQHGAPATSCSSSRFQDSSVGPSEYKKVSSSATSSGLETLHDDSISRKNSKKTASTQLTQGHTAATQQTTQLHTASTQRGSKAQHTASTTGAAPKGNGKVGVATGIRSSRYSRKGALLDHYDVGDRDHIPQAQRLQREALGDEEHLIEQPASWDETRECTGSAPTYQSQKHHLAGAYLPPNDRNYKATEQDNIDNEYHYDVDDNNKKRYENGTHLQRDPDRDTTTAVDHGHEFEPEDGGEGSSLSGLSLTSRQLAEYVLRNPNRLRQLLRLMASNTNSDGSKSESSSGHLGVGGCTLSLSSLSSNEQARQFMFQLLRNRDFSSSAEERHRIYDSPSMTTLGAGSVGEDVGVEMTQQYEDHVDNLYAADYSSTTTTTSQRGAGVGVEREQIRGHHDEERKHLRRQEGAASSRMNNSRQRGLYRNNSEKRDRHHDADIGPAASTGHGHQGNKARTKEANGQRQPLRHAQSLTGIYDSPGDAHFPEQEPGLGDEHRDHHDLPYYNYNSSSSRRQHHQRVLQEPCESSSHVDVDQHWCVDSQYKKLTSNTGHNLDEDEDLHDQGPPPRTSHNANAASREGGSGRGLPATSRKCTTISLSKQLEGINQNYNNYNSSSSHNQEHEQQPSGGLRPTSGPRGQHQSVEVARKTHYSYNQSYSCSAQGKNYHQQHFVRQENLHFRNNGAAGGKPPGTTSTRENNRCGGPTQRANNAGGSGGGAAGRGGGSGRTNNHGGTRGVRHTQTHTHNGDNNFNQSQNTSKRRVLQHQHQAIVQRSRNQTTTTTSVDSTTRGVTAREVLAPVARPGVPAREEQAHKLIKPEDTQ
ncbi:unnamed protein product [Amoebophrya sp. A25]|nr:unnamed protein product [Amoebophrya sp. A25]|eukprot:GSA25T00011866001.1